MTRFQIILTGLFVFFIIGGVIAFATFRGGGGQNAVEVVFWGTLPQQVADTWLQSAALKSDAVRIRYVEKDPASLESDFIEALASGVGPDLLMIPQALLLPQYNKLTVIPFKSLPERDFKDTFIEEGELFLSVDGVVGLPFTVDPLVMYWNRDMLSAAGLASPPKFWDEFYLLAPTFNERNQAGGLTKTLAALGGFDNIKNAKEILSLLIMQSGNPIVTVTPQGLSSVLRERFDAATPPTESALRFYTEFANPTKTVYSWSKGLPPSQDAFAGEKLATYIGFASELPTIRRKNPNLNFDLTAVPQIRDSKKKLTYGKISALVVPKNSADAQAAFTAATLLTSRGALDSLSQLTNLPPVRRDLLAIPPSQAFQSVFYSGALISKAWLDPSAAETSAIFRNMVESVVSGRERLDGAVSRADAALDQLLKVRR